MSRLPSTVVLDPEEILVPLLGWLEEQFRFTDPDSDVSDSVLKEAADAAAALGAELTRVGSTSPQWFAPDGRSEICPPLVVRVDLAGTCASLRDASSMTGGDSPFGLLSTYINQLARSARLAVSPDAAALVEAVSLNPSGRILTPGQYGAYVRYVRATIADPLQRFIAIPPGTDHLAQPMGWASPVCGRGGLGTDREVDL